MVNLNNLLVGMMVGFFAQILTFFQLQGQLKYDWIRDNYWLTVFAGIPISILFMYSVNIDLYLSYKLPGKLAFKFN